MEIELRYDPRLGGVLLPLRVNAGASREGVLGVHDGRLKVAVRTAPERGKANRAVLALLAGVLSAPRRDLVITAGARSSRKTVLVRGLTPDEVRSRIGPALESEESR